MEKPCAKGPNPNPNPTVEKLDCSVETVLERCPFAMQHQFLAPEDPLPMGEYQMGDIIPPQPTFSSKGVTRMPASRAPSIPFQAIETIEMRRNSRRRQSAPLARRLSKVSQRDATAAVDGAGGLTGYRSGSLADLGISGMNFESYLPRVSLLPCLLRLVCCCVRCTDAWWLLATVGLPLATGKPAVHRGARRSLEDPWGHQLLQGPAALASLKNQPPPCLSSP